jgi:hypothetical protein
MPKEDLESKLLPLNKKLQELYEDPIKNSAQILKIKKQIEEIYLEVLNSSKDTKDKHASRYDEELGVFITPEEKQKYDEAETLVTTKLGVEFDPTKHSPGGTVLGEQWYNTRQVAFLTGNTVPAGRERLKKLLGSNDLSTPLSFSYLKKPDQNDPTLNHFVAMSVRKESGKVIVDYVDSNGQLMDQGDRDVLKNIYGEKLEIIYRDQKGKDLPEEQAIKNPMLIHRSQFDGNSCGPRSVAATQMFENAALLTGQAREDFISKGLLDIEGKDFTEVRKEHQYLMDKGIDRQTALEARSAGQVATKATEPVSHANLATNNTHVRSRL